MPVPSSDAGVPAIYGQQHKTGQGDEYEQAGNDDRDTAFVARSVPEQTLVPFPVRLDVENDGNCKQRAGRHMRNGPVMPYFMHASVSGKMESDSGQGRKYEYGYQCPVDDKNGFHLFFFTQS